MFYTEEEWKLTQSELKSTDSLKVADIYFKFWICSLKSK